MSDQNSKRLKLARTLRSALQAEIFEDNPSPEEISQMLIENGDDPDEVASSYKELVLAKIRSANKERMLAYRRSHATSETFALRGASAKNTSELPSIETMRARIEALKSTPEFEKSNLAIAFRNGNVQSDSDISSLYLDLLELGVINDDPET
jgi:hypothetical protein